MHWIDQKARKILKRKEKHVVASGISISGHIHIGHSNDVFIADAVSKAVDEQGGEAKVIWYSDDFDPLRRIPWPLKEEGYKEHLG
ncbi:MAG: lysine--tRNA ligase, partial [Hadesarchaea archaeon]|nr:lysine--tRNA ligase [Hadesarchaea archaeon]